MKCRSKILIIFYVRQSEELLLFHCSYCGNVFMSFYYCYNYYINLSLYFAGLKQQRTAFDDKKKKRDIDTYQPYFQEYFFIAEHG